MFTYFYGIMSTMDLNPRPPAPKLTRAEERRLSELLELRRQYREALPELKAKMLRSYDSRTRTLAQMALDGGFRHVETLRSMLKRQRTAEAAGTVDDTEGDD